MFVATTIITTIVVIGITKISIITTIATGITKISIINTIVIGITKISIITAIVTGITKISIITTIVITKISIITAIVTGITKISIITTKAWQKQFRVGLAKIGLSAATASSERRRQEYIRGEAFSKCTNCFYCLSKIFKGKHIL